MPTTAVNFFRLFLLLFVLIVALWLVYGDYFKPGTAHQSFTLAVIPDTQNYIDFRHQKARGFVIDGSEMFIRQMEYIASRSPARGGDILFAASVGDVWQHQTKLIAGGHEQRGLGIEPDPILARQAKRTEEVLTIELPTAVAGYRILDQAGIPFGVAPGNHDYDAAWSVAGYPPNREKNFSTMEWTVENLGILHIGGLDNFRSVFGDQTDFFRDKPWYVAGYKGGANSAQKFSAAGYEFLHIALEMQPGDDVLEWVETVLRDSPGLPTIITTHDFLNTRGQRRANPLIDLARVDPKFHNSAEQVWQKLIRNHDQIFLVLCGHHHGQAMRVDANASGNPVYQILADYQDRGQAGLDAGSEKLVGLGDGWLRLLRFDFTTVPASIEVQTYSSHYQTYSSDLETYAEWYREREQPEMSAAEFNRTDDFTILLEGFTQRFDRTD